MSDIQEKEIYQICKEQHVSRKQAKLIYEEKVERLKAEKAKITDAKALKPKSKEKQVETKDASFDSLKDILKDMSMQNSTMTDMITKENVDVKK